jgi:glyoxylase-like metal-dependent hydrolase (beta-lactamase superfamily II)
MTPIDLDAAVSRRRLLTLTAGAGAALALERLVAPSRALAAPVSRLASGAPFVPAILPFMIGDVQAYSISDGTIVLPTIQPLIAPEGDPAAVAANLQAAYLPTDHAAFGVNILLLRLGSRLVLVDAGNGIGGAPATGHLVASLATLGITPDQITDVVVSHAHGDHIAGLVDPTSGALTFPHADVHINGVESAYWTSASPDTSKLRLPPEQRAASVAAAKKTLLAVGGKLHSAEPGVAILPGIELVSAYGHTPGHCAIRITSGSTQVVHIADLVHHPTLQFAHPEWTIAFDSDPAAAIVARRQLFERLAADKTLVFTYHLPFPGIGYIRATGGAYEWVPRNWAV